MTDYIRNKRINFDFEVLDTFEVGAVLFGYEVKSIRNHKGSLSGAYVVVRAGEAFLVGASLSPYQIANTPKNYDPERTRKLLLKKKELLELEKKDGQAGLTIVPIKWYNKNRKIKLLIALVRGQKKADKREKIKERDTKRHIERLLKNQ